MAVTQKDFVAFARLIAGEAGFKSEARRGDFAVKVADIFAASNPRFDRKRFMDACGVEEEV